MLKRFVPVLVVCFISSVALADGYRTSVESGGRVIPVVVVTGTPYEMGYAFGDLMKDEVKGLLLGYLGKAQASGDLRYTDISLDAAWKSIEPYTDKRFVEELHGVADGADIPFEKVRRAHMIPVISDYACSGIAVWGAATTTGHLYQIRNLDYDTLAGLQQYPCLVVYIPKQGIPHLNVTFAGSIGVNTGMNAEGITLSEIGDSPGRDFPFDLHGTHFTTMFRTILYDAHTLDQAVNIIKNAKRIKKYHYVVGDGKATRAVKMKAWAPDLQIWTDNDPKDELAPNVFKDIVYHAEGRDPKAVAHIKKNYGKYDSEKMIDLAKTVPTIGGNLISAVYDATTLEAWVAYADNEKNAYLCPYVHLALKDYLPYNPESGKMKVLKVFKGTPKKN